MTKTTDPKHQALLAAARAVVEDATLLDGYVTYGMLVDPQLIDHLRAAIEDDDDSQTTTSTEG